jgi:hypothetical protein
VIYEVSHTLPGALVNTIKEKRLNKKQIVTLLVGISLIMVLVLSSCSSGTGATPTATVTVTTTKTAQPTATATTTAASVEKTYKVLNPAGTYIPVDCKPLAPRLTTFDGKTIFYYQSEANAVIMPVLIEKLRKDYPRTTFTYQNLETGAFGLSTPGEELKGMDAVIRGVSW